MLLSTLFYKGLTKYIFVSFWNLGLRFFTVFSPPLILIHPMHSNLSLSSWRQLGHWPGGMSFICHTTPTLLLAQHRFMGKYSKYSSPLHSHNDNSTLKSTSRKMKQLKAKSTALLKSQNSWPHFLKGLLNVVYCGVAFWLGWQILRLFKS